MSNILVSTITPTRGRPDRLGVMLRSLVFTASDPSRIQFILKADDDDPHDYEALKNTYRHIKVVRSPRGGGYNSMPRFVHEACAEADGVWCFLIDDDAYIEGFGWDDQLSLVDPARQVAQCEYYCLGPSEYREVHDEPNGLFLPTATARQIDPTIGPGSADAMWRQMTVDQGWKKRYLRGIRYCHDGRPR